MHCIEPCSTPFNNNIKYKTTFNPSEHTTQLSQVITEKKLGITLPPRAGGVKYKSEILSSRRARCRLHSLGPGLDMYDKIGYEYDKTCKPLL